MTNDNHYESTRTPSGAVRIDGGARLDDFFRALADSRRRYALYYLREEERASLAETARQVAAWEHECPPDDVSDETVENLKIDLYHNHLPRLRDATLLEYDQRSGMLVYRDPPDLVSACLDLSYPRDRSE